MLWSSLLLLDVVLGLDPSCLGLEQQLLDSSCGKHTFCLWHVLLEAAGSGSP